MISGGVVPRSAPLSELAGRFHALEQRCDITTVDADDSDTSGRLEQSRIERSDLHVVEIHQRATASATALPLASETRDDSFVGGPHMAAEAGSRTGGALDANPRGVESVHPLAPFTKLSHPPAAVQNVQRQTERGEVSLDRKRRSRHHQPALIAPELRNEGRQTITLSPSWRSAERVRHRQPGVVRAPVPLRLVAVYSTRN